MSGERQSYRFGPLERRGLLGGVRAGQAATLCLGLLAAIGMLDSAPSAVGAFAGVLALALAVAVATTRLGGRTLEEWGPVAGAFMLRLLARGHRFRSAAPAAGMVWSARGRTIALLDPMAHTPPALRGVAIVEAEYRDRRVGALSERGGKRLTAVLACRVVSFALLDPDAQERRLAHWGLVLSGAADTAVRRIQWIERTAPAQGDELARWLHKARDPAIPLRGAPIVESYLELIGSSARVAQAHEILVAVQVDASRTRERAGGRAASALIEATERVAQGLEAAEITVLGALSRGQFSRVMRTAFDPYAGSELAALETADERRRGLTRGQRVAARRA